MKALIFSDLHFDSVLKDNYKWWELESRTANKEHIKSLEWGVDCVLLCGDNAELSKNFKNHKELFKLLRNTFECPIGFIIGNHELWKKQVSAETLLYKNFERLAKQEGLVYLENKNLRVKDWTIIGTYGHYDYSLGTAHPDLNITEENFKTGMAIIGNKKITWMDKPFINLKGQTDKEFCDKLISRFEKKIQAAKGKLITISHTIPNKKVVGHKDSLKSDFLGAFAGTTKLEKILEKYDIAYHFCGHTHARATNIINKTKVVNIGSDYQELKYILLDTNKNSIKFLP